MKVNTDGVLLGAMVNYSNPSNILDIGTGTGVIALMMAQRFPEALVDAVEIDALAAETASKNFSDSPFANRLQLYSGSFENYFQNNRAARYDLIVTNPPFYINSLPSESTDKALAKHADKSFFDMLINSCAEHLHENGLLSVILPIDTAALVSRIAAANGLIRRQIITIQSFAHDDPHRELLTFGFKNGYTQKNKIVIYKKPKEFTEEYTILLRNFLTIF